MTSARGVRTFLAAAALGTLLSATVTACGTPNDKPAEGVTPSTSAASPSTSTAPTADWQTVDANGATVLIPADWSQHMEGKSVLFKPPLDSVGYNTAQTVFLVHDGLWEGTPEEIDYLGDDELSDIKKDPGVKNARRLPDLKVNGANLFHVQAENETHWLDVYGTLNGSERTTVDWQISKLSYPDRKKADAIIDPVMQTFKFN